MATPHPVFRADRANQSQLSFLRGAHKVADHVQLPAATTSQHWHMSAILFALPELDHGPCPHESILLVSRLPLGT